MVLKEFHKIWNVRALLLVVIVGGALFYSWVMGQMNLKHLPLFETVEVEVGIELLKRYGTPRSLPRYKYYMSRQRRN